MDKAIQADAQALVWRQKKEMCMPNNRIGIIGAGGMLEYHLRGFRQAGAEVAILVDQDRKKADAAARKYEIPLTGVDIGDILSQSNIDAVSVITPNGTHQELVLKALGAGKHVFCEKPPAINAQETVKMADAAREAMLVLMFDFNNRHRPESQILKEMVFDGKLINSAQAYWVRRAGIPGFGTWFTDKKQSGGGPLIDLLHMLDLALWFMDYPEPAWVMGNTFDTFQGDETFKGPWGIADGTGPTNTETAAHGYVRFATGQCLTVHNSWAELVERERVGVELQGSRLGAQLLRIFNKDGIDDTAVDRLKIFRQGAFGCRDNANIGFMPDPDMGRVASAAHFVDVLEGREKPINTPAEAVTLMRIIDAMYRSARQGSPVSLVNSTW